MELGDTAVAATTKKSAIRLEYFYQPILLAGKASVVIPAVSYAIIFGFASVLNTVEIPQLFAMTFTFNPQQIGLQFIAVIVG